MRFRLGATLIAVGSVWAPTALLADSTEPAARGIRPAEVEVARRVSGLVLGVQRQEREIAAALGLADLEPEIARLQRAVRDLQSSERSALAQSLLGGQVASPGTAELATRRSARRQRVLERVGQLRRRRIALQDRMPAIQSPRQRRVAQRAARKLDQIEREVEEALHAPPGERVGRLMALERRLTVDHYGIQSERLAEEPSRTFQTLPLSALAPVEVIEESP